MPRIRIYRGNDHERRRRAFDFTVVLIPTAEETSPSRRRKNALRRVRNPYEPGFQVTVPLLPGVITYGRTEAEALEMARDAIRCHLDGLTKSGEMIPDESKVHTKKLRVALSA